MSFQSSPHLFWFLRIILGRSERQFLGTARTRKARSLSWKMSLQPTQLWWRYRMFGRTGNIWRDVTDSTVLRGLASLNTTSLRNHPQRNVKRKFLTWFRTLSKTRSIWTPPLGLSFASFWNSNIFSLCCLVSSALGSRTCALWTVMNCTRQDYPLRLKNSRNWFGNSAQERENFSERRKISFIPSYVPWVEFERLACQQITWN